MSRTKLTAAHPTAAGTEGAKHSEPKRSRHDCESAGAPAKSLTRRSGTTIRIAGGTSNLDRAPPPPSTALQPPRRSVSQPPYPSRAGLPTGRPKWATAASPQLQVVHPSSQHAFQQSPSRRPPKASGPSQQVSPRKDFSKFAYAGPSDPSQVPVGRRLTLPPAISRSASSRPHFTAQGAEYSHDGDQAGIEPHVRQLDGDLGRMIDQAKSQANVIDTTESGSKPKRKRQKKDDAPKKIDLSVPEEGSWVRGTWVPDETAPRQPPSPPVPHDNAAKDNGKVKSTSDAHPSRERPVDHPRLSFGGSSFQSESSFQAQGRPESQLPPGRQPQQRALLSSSNRRYRRDPPSQHAPSCSSLVMQSSIARDTQEPLFLSQDTEEDSTSDHRRYRGQGPVERVHHDIPHLAADGRSRRAATTAPHDTSHQADRQTTPPHRAPLKTVRASRSEKTYSTRLPTAYTHRPRGEGLDDPEEHVLDDGISYNQDLVRKRRRKTVDPSQVSREPLRERYISPEDTFAIADPSNSEEKRDWTDDCAVVPSDERFQDEPEEEGEEELDEDEDHHVADEEEALHPFDDYRANTPSPPAGQRPKVLPQHQQAVDELFDSPTRPLFYDPSTMRPLTERFVLIPGQQYTPVPTQSPGAQAQSCHRKKTKNSSCKHRDRHSPRRHAQHYHDKVYASQRSCRHRHSSRCHSCRHRHYSSTDSDEDDDIWPRGRLRMSRHESAGPRIDKYVDNSRRQVSDPTQPPRPPLAPRPYSQSVPHRRPDPKTRAAQRVAILTDLSPIKSVTGLEKRQVMLERSSLESHPVDKHLIGAASRDRRRARLEQLTGLGPARRRRKEKENTAPRSAPAAIDFRRPSDVADNGELVQATQSTIGQFPTQADVTEVRTGGTEPGFRRKKINQLRLTRRKSPPSPPRTSHRVRPTHEAGTTSIDPVEGGTTDPLPSQLTPTPRRPATPLHDLIPPLTRIPMGAGSQNVPQTPQRETEISKTPSSVMSTRDQARARRDAADKALVDAMLTPADAEKLARELAKETEKVEGEEVVENHDDIQDFDMAAEQPDSSVMEPTTSTGPEVSPTTPSCPPAIESTHKTPANAQNTVNATTGPSRSIGKTMTREAISDTGQEMRELLKKLKSSASPFRQSSGKGGPSSTKGSKHDRSRRKKHKSATPLVSASDPKQATTPSFMQKILPDGPPIPTQAQIRPTQVPGKDPEEDFEVKLKEPRQLLISDLTGSNKKRLGKHVLEDLPGTKEVSNQGSTSASAKDGGRKSKTGPGRLGLGKPGRQSTQFGKLQGTQFGGSQFSQSVTRPYKDPTTANTPRLVQEDRDKFFLTPTQRSLGPSQPLDNEFEELEDDELIDDDDAPIAPFVHPLHKTTTPKLQRSLAEAPIRGSRTGTKLGKTTSGFVAPKPVARSTNLDTMNSKTDPRLAKKISLGLTQARDILTEDSTDIIEDPAEDSNDMIEDDEDEEDYYCGEFDTTQDFKGLDHTLGLAGPSAPSAGQSAGRQGNTQGGSWWK